MQRGGHHLEPQGSRATLSAVRWVAFNRMQEMSSSRAKKDWRRDMRKRREQAVPASPAVDALTRTEQWQQGQVIASYLPTGSEQDPAPLDVAARRAGKRLVYPRVMGEGQMVFKILEPDDALAPDATGIAAPQIQAETVPANAIDLFIVPLLACDDLGVRLGYGGGYYDRQLGLTEGFRCGLGYQLQRVAQLPSESHDILLQAFLCETGLEYF